MVEMLVDVAIACLVAARVQTLSTFSLPSPHHNIPKPIPHHYIWRLLDTTVHRVSRLDIPSTVRSILGFTTHLSTNAFLNRLGGPH